MSTDFIKAIFGETSPSDQHQILFCGFPDDPNGIEWWSAHAKKTENLPFVIKPQNNCYFQLAKYKPNHEGKFKARKELVIANYAILLDDIQTKSRDDVRLPLSWKIETSPGNYQGGLILDEPCTDRDLYEQVVAALGNAGWSDPGASGAARWARLPIGVNTKAKYLVNGVAPKVTLAELHPEYRYSIDQIIKAFGLTLGTNGKKKKSSATNEDAVLQALKAKSLWKSELEPGKHDMSCPWVEQHTDGVDHGTVYFEPTPANQDAGGFNCQHGHCSNKSISDLKKHLDCGVQGVDIETELDRLGALSVVAYERIRKETSEALGIRSTVLDKLVAARRKENDVGGIGFDDVEPWHEPIVPAELLTTIEATVKRYIICNPETATTVALWVAMTWLMDVIHIAPLAIITAPEKRCAKTLLLTVMKKLVKKPIAASGISPAALFRSIEKWQPCLLIDEADAFMKDNEEIRLLLNSGHSRDAAYIIRTVGENHEPTRFNTWGAKVISGISANKLADTLTDRAVLLELRRKLEHESVERLRYAEPEIFEELTSMLARFAEDYQEAIRAARPALPSSLNDRAQDNWEPLLAIADVAGGLWPDKARKAALKISGTEAPSMSTSTELLHDIKEVFELNRVDRISTANLILELCSDDERPWKTYNRGFPVSPRQLSNRLKEYGIHSRTIRIISETSKGYHLEQFQESFDRYLSIPSLLSVTTSQPATGVPSSVTDMLPVTDRSVTSSKVTDTRVTDEYVTKTKGNNNVTLKPAGILLCDVVTHRNPETASSIFAGIDDSEIEPYSAEDMPDVDC